MKIFKLLSPLLKVCFSNFFFRTYDILQISKLFNLIFWKRLN